MTDLDTLKQAAMAARKERFTVVGTEEDAHFISLANPTAILALCDRLERAEAALRELVERFDRYEQTPGRALPCQACDGVFSDHRESCPYVRARAALGGK